jgi:FkbM family methyltransferase
MKTTTRIALRLVHATGIGNLIAGSRMDSPFIKRLVPHPSFFRKDDAYTVQRDGAFFCVNRSDYVQWYIYAGLPDFSWKYALDSVRGIDAPVIFDIGSNVGAFSFKTAVAAVAANTSPLIYAFDPNPLIKKIFTNNLHLNKGVEKHVRFFANALGETIGQSYFSFYDGNSGGGALGSETGILVDLSTLDNFCEEQGIRRIDFIKIDVEGYEPFVIGGGAEMIRRCRPDMYIEMTPGLFSKYGRSAEEIFDFLFGLGYRIYLEEEGLKELKPQAVSETIARYPQFNILVKK